MGKCPHCGGQIQLVARHRQAGRIFESSVDFDSAPAAATLDAWRRGPELAGKREKPTRALNRWDILYPLSRACITGGIFVGLPAFAAGVALEVHLPGAWAFGAAWLGAAREWFGWNIYDFVMSIEEKLQRDIDRDGQIGAPPPAPPPSPAPPIWINRRDEDGKTITEHLKLPVDSVKLSEFARFILDGGNLSRDDVTGATSLSQTDYNRLLGAMESKGLANKTNNSNKRELTAAGRAMLSKVA